MHIHIYLLDDYTTTSLILLDSLCNLCNLCYLLIVALVSAPYLQLASTV